MALEDVAQRLGRICKALDAASVPFALVGGQAVALWVATRDPAAVRTTKDIDLLLCREDLPRARAAADAAGMDYFEVMGVGMFLDRQAPNPRHAVHLVWAGCRVRPEYDLPFADHRPAPRAFAGAAGGLAARTGSHEAVGRSRPGPRSPPRHDRRRPGRAGIARRAHAGIGQAAGSSARGGGAVERPGAAPACALPVPSPSGSDQPSVGARGEGSRRRWRPIFLRPCNGKSRPLRHSDSARSCA